MSLRIVCGMMYTHTLVWISWWSVECCLQNQSLSLSLKKEFPYIRQHLLDVLKKLSVETVKLAKISLHLIDKQGLQDKNSSGETSQQVRNILHKQAESRMRQGKGSEPPQPPWENHPQGKTTLPTLYALCSCSICHCTIQFTSITF